MMRVTTSILCTLAWLFLTASCERHPKDPAQAAVPPEQVAEITPAEKTADTGQSVVRINATIQTWNTWQPWEKNPPARRRALGAIVAPGIVITTAEMAADAIFLEFESIDGTRYAPAKVLAIDYEANLALLTSGDDPSSEKFFANTRHFETAAPPAVGDPFTLVQVEANGSILQTTGKLQSVDLTSTMVSAGGFLTYKIKASMQNAASSFSLPVLRDGKLAGILFSYDSKDQICEVGSTEILTRFIQTASAGHWSGFPSLGVSIAATEDPSFRQWLKLGDNLGGIYIRNVRKGSSAETSGILKGDVLLAIDDLPIDRRGYIKHPVYGNLLWGHWIRGERSNGDTVRLSIWRDGRRMEQAVVLRREDESKRIVPPHMFDQQPDYLVKGGLVFQELTLPLLQSFGKDWQTSAPLDLLDAYENPESYESSVNRIVFLSGVIPTPATIGYERLRNLIVRQVNGQPIRDMAGLVSAFDNYDQTVHSIEFAGEPLTIHLDELISMEIDGELLQRGLGKLSRTGAKP